MFNIGRSSNQRSASLKDPSNIPQGTLLKPYADESSLFQLGVDEDFLRSCREQAPLVIEEKKKKKLISKKNSNLLDLPPQIPQKKYFLKTNKNILLGTRFICGLMDGSMYLFLVGLMMYLSIKYGQEQFIDFNQLNWKIWQAFRPNTWKYLTFILIVSQFLVYIFPALWFRCTLSMFVLDLRYEGSLMNVFFRESVARLSSIMSFGLISFPLTFKSKTLSLMDWVSGVELVHKKGQRFLNS